MSSPMLDGPPQDAVAAEQYKEDIEGFKSTAKLWTNKYATGDDVELSQLMGSTRDGDVGESWIDPRPPPRDDSAASPTLPKSVGAVQAPLASPPPEAQGEVVGTLRL